MRLNRWPLLAATTFLLASTLHAAQSDIVSPCDPNGDSAQPASKTLTNGSRILIRHLPDGPPGQTCEVTVQDRNGRVIFSDRGFSAGWHEATGHDIDDDGQPDVVLGIDTRGPSACCWEYPVISMGRTPRELLRLPTALFDFQSAPGKTLIWTSAEFVNLGQDASQAPKVSTAHEFRPNGFLDVTADYCRPLLENRLDGPVNLRQEISRLDRRAKQDSRTNNGETEDLEVTRQMAMTLALQQIYCRQFDEAAQLVLEVWPATEQNRIRSLLKAAVADRWPDLASQMEKWD